MRSPTPYSGRFRHAEGGETLTPLSHIAPFVDDFEPWPGPTSGAVGHDPLSFPGYLALLADAGERSGSDEAVITGRGTLQTGGGSSLPIAVVACVFEFIGGSMGAAVGERVVQAYDRAREEGLPVLVLAASGGARVQEGMVSLIQMARTADAARRHSEAGLLQVAWLGSPTTGGVYASFSSLADVVWADPGAVVGFAGPRVVEQTTGEAVPQGGHTAESALAAGVVDGVLDAHAARKQLDTLVRVAHLALNPRAETLRTSGGPGPAPHGPSPAAAWDQVLAVRAADRPSGAAWLDRLVPERVELCGDRAGGIDPVVRCALGVTTDGVAVAAIALDRHTGDGRPRPAGFRAARRLLALAARLQMPVLTIVDTPGADPSHESERTGVAGEIARTFAAVTGHPRPTVSLVVGEGGSGGALAFAAADRLLLTEGAIFSVIGPEGAAAILHRDAARAPEVAEQLKLTGPDLVDLGIVDGVVGDDDAVGAVARALAEATAGEGRARFDAATARWVEG